MRPSSSTPSLSSWSLWAFSFHSPFDARTHQRASESTYPSTYEEAPTKLVWCVKWPKSPSLKPMAPTNLTMSRNIKLIKKDILHTKRKNNNTWIIQWWYCHISYFAHTYKKKVWFVLRLIRFFSSLDIIENGKMFDIHYWYVKTETVGRRDEKNGIKTGKNLEKWTRDEKEKKWQFIIFR